jgi:hypothetical protein
MEMKEGRVRSSFSRLMISCRAWELLSRYMYGHPNYWLISWVSRLVGWSQSMHRNAREMRSCKTSLPISQL